MQELCKTNVRKDFKWIDIITVEIKKIILIEYRWENKENRINK